MNTLNTLNTLNTFKAPTTGYVNPAFVVSTISKYKLYKQLGVQQKVSRLNPLNHIDVLPHDMHIVAVRKVTPAMLNEIECCTDRFHAKERLELGVYLIEYVTSELEADEVVKEAVRKVILEDNHLYEIERLSSETIKIEREYRAGRMDMDEIKANCTALNRIINDMINITTPSNIFKIALDLRADMYLDLAKREYTMSTTK